MNNLWKSGDHISLRGILDNKVWLATAVIVVKDSHDETILLQLPGSQCMFPDGLFRRKQGDYSLGSRWKEAKNNSWNLKETVWETNRFLIFLEPRKTREARRVTGQSRTGWQRVYMPCRVAGSLS